MEPPKPNRFAALLLRHAKALGFIFTVIIPAILRTGRRPVIFSRWSGMGDVISTLPAALELRKRHPGAVFLYNCDPVFSSIPLMGGAAERCTHFKDIGIIGYWYRFLTGGFYHFAHGDDSPATASKEPMFKEFCRQFDVLAPESHPRLQIGEAALNRARATLVARGIAEKDLIFFHVGPTWPVKEWPGEYWAALAKGLREGGFPNLAQVGLGAYMKSQQTQVPHSLGTEVHLGKGEVAAIAGAISLVDAFTLEETVAAISLARLFVGVDSGLLHIAACLGIPSVGIFGPTLPQMFYEQKFRQNFVASSVECAGCHHRTPRLHWITGCPYNIRCMKEMLPAEVAGACLSAMGVSSPGPAARQ